MQSKNLRLFKAFIQHLGYEELPKTEEKLSQLFKNFWFFVWNYPYVKEGTDNEPDFIDGKGAIYEKGYAYNLKFSKNLMKTYHIDIQQDCQAEIRYAQKHQHPYFYIVFYNLAWHENIIYLRETSPLETEVIISKAEDDPDSNDNRNLRIITLKNPLTEKKK